MHVAEFIILCFGILIRLLLSKASGSLVLKSIGYSVTESWESVEEAIALKEDGVSAYEGNVVHQAPLVVTFWRIIYSIFNQKMWLFFVILDVGISLFILNAVTRIYKILHRLECRRPTNEVCAESRKQLGLREDGWKTIRLMALSWYMINPYSLIACASQSTIAMNNICILWLILSITERRHRLSSGLAAVATYFNYYPVGFLFVILSQHYKDTRRTLDILVVFTGMLTGLLFASYLMEDGSWAFLDSVYLFLVKIPDYTPHMSLFWYLFAEMFDHFREFFVCVFLVTTTFLPLPLSFRLKDNPTFLCLIVWLTICIFRPYPAIGELGIIVSILPLWRHLFVYMRTTLLTICVSVAVLVLGPLMSYLWLYAGSANANFYFAITLLHSVTQIYLLSHVLSAFFKHEFLLRYGPKPKMPDGTDVKTRLE